ncbi:LytR/AlgR family response regulator transcription factor [Lacihabitans soyangensis]|uniref:DNA-binding response regulator n=1 Tax=Lacihabitans soyangensis TaxID=869394 RepID=A0AAE3KT51_9BACT|nr:LytTR family DNA-binding domain-containing protein [Lacihabitans soyangensis]MCP9764032.1 DNA-binding response regulator [Lacihabitans soyangensis]
MIEILILEDDYIWQSKIEVMLHKYPNYKIVGFAENTIKGKQMIEHLNPDIILADIYLGTENTIDVLFNNLRQKPTVFITSSDEKSNFENVFEFPMSNFIMKPFHEFTLIAILNQLKVNYIKKQLPHLIFKTSNAKSTKIFVDNISHIQVEGNYSIFYTCDSRKFARKIALKKTISNLQEYFIQANKNTAVNISKIEKMENYQIKLHKLVKEITIGRRYQKKLLELDLYCG